MPEHTLSHATLGARPYKTTNVKRMDSLSFTSELTGPDAERIVKAVARIRDAEKQEKKRLQAEGIRRKMESGEGYGAAPVGYINRRVGDRAWIEPDPVTYPLVQEAKVLHATGKYSLRKLCSIMAEKGLRSRNGKVMGPSAMQWMLRSPSYSQ